MVIINLNISKKFVGSTVPHVYVTPRYRCVSPSVKIMAET